MKADVRIFKDNKSLSMAAAEIFVEAAAQSISARARFLAALSGGSTPADLYRLLAAEAYREKVNWAKTYVFWGDERCVPPDDARSNYHQAYETFLQHIPIPDANIQRIKGELEPAEASDDYARTLKRFAAPGLGWPRFELVLLGLGADGHTASLFPGSQVEASSSTLAVTAHYRGRPAQRVTLTPPVFNSARKVLFLVTGEDKAATLARVLDGVFIPEQLPAQRIRPIAGQVTWLVDEAAGKNLSAKEFYE
jgi:6-phosphogluconolactonase